jgi:hypothetical protein
VKKGENLSKEIFLVLGEDSSFVAKRRQFALQFVEAVNSSEDALNEVGDGEAWNLA